ncbi:hypothetical protein FVE85_3610 [Porphyridium purpureum]|uniref:Uncharacterized protein n=1 Tax=Porphyridium purpureum TaxID=35688 RepID=A0A5J4YMC3_PORPP|nr:hypothetical protein FVE85_3610 [Porphyridium purpureum]|eukprot:POR0224..scf249_10
MMCWWRTSGQRIRNAYFAALQARLDTAPARAIHASAATLRIRKHRKKGFQKGGGFNLGATVWSAYAPSPSTSPGDEEPEGPFYAIRVGREKFRGVVLRSVVYDAFVKDVKGVEAKSIETLEEAVAFCARSSLEKRDKACSRFFAFRYGLDGARLISTSETVFRSMLKRFRAPARELAEFSNMTQALVFCEQAGTLATDWQTLAGSVRFVARNPSLDQRDMERFYRTQCTRGSLPTGPWPMAHDLLKAVRAQAHAPIRPGFVGGEHKHIWESGASSVRRGEEAGGESSADPACSGESKVTCELGSAPKSSLTDVERVMLAGPAKNAKCGDRKTLAQDNRCSHRS